MTLNSILRVIVMLAVGGLTSYLAQAEDIFSVNEVHGSLMPRTADAPVQLVFEACLVEQISGVSLVGKEVELTDGETTSSYQTDGRGCFRWGEAHALLAHSLRYVQFTREVRVREAFRPWQRLFQRTERSQIFKIPVVVDVSNLAVADGRYIVVPKSDTDFKDSLFFGQPL